MTSERVSRHQAQKSKLKILRGIREEIETYRISTDKTIERGFVDNQNSEVLQDFSLRQKQDFDNFNSPITVSFEETEDLLAEMRSRWNERQLDLLLRQCRDSVLYSVIGPFGLGKIVAAMDKNGGNITTVHNAENGVFANQNDQDRYNVEYKHTDYENGGFNKERKKIFQKQEKIIDAYTGAELPKNGQMHLDHVISSKVIHEDKALRLSTNKDQRDKIASDKANVVTTNQSLNQSKGDKDLLEWKDSMRKDGSGKTNGEHYKVNDKLASDVSATAKRHYQIEKTLAVAKHFGSEIVVTGAQESTKMGLQQSLGLLLTEFFSAIFDEIADSYKNGFIDSLREQSFIEALKTRLSRISERVAARWKDACYAFSEGAISGFLSNLVTMLINMLVTTGRRAVRVIREGFLSILKAIKIAIFPPKEMTPAEASDAAIKLIITGITVSIGILSEEAVQDIISAFFLNNIPVLAPFASTVGVAFVGVMTGIASALIVYGIDKLDIFGVHSQIENSFILKELESITLETNQKIEKLYTTEMLPKFQ